MSNPDHKIGDLLAATIYQSDDSDVSFVLGIICKILRDRQGTIKYAIDWTNRPYDSIAYNKGDIDGFKEILTWVHNTAKYRNTK